MNLFLVLYMAGALAGLVPANEGRTACEARAVAETAGFAARGDAQFTVACEARGAGDMVWKLHPEWRN